MDNQTSIYATWLLNNSQDIELVNAIQSGVSCFCSLIILFKVLDFKGMFKSVQQSRKVARRTKELKELEKEYGELRAASKAIYQMVHFAEDNDGRIKRFRQAIFPEKK